MKNPVFLTLVWTKVSVDNKVVYRSVLHIPQAA